MQEVNSFFVSYYLLMVGLAFVVYNFLKLGPNDGHLKRMWVGLYLVFCVAIANPAMYYDEWSHSEIEILKSDFRKIELSEDESFQALKYLANHKHNPKTGRIWYQYNGVYR